MNCGCRLALGMGLVLLSACATVRDEVITTRGIVTYRQRIALPPGARVEVRLMEVTTDGGSSSPVAEVRFPAPRQFPIPYELTYPAHRIKPHRRYAIQARVLDGGKPWMVTATVNHLMDGAYIDRADVVMQLAQ